MGSTCWECGKYFPSGPVALGQHCQSTSHTECRRCYETFNNAQDRIDHEADQHAYCEDCDREFQSPNNARQVRPCYLTNPVHSPSQARKKNRTLCLTRPSLSNVAFELQNPPRLFDPMPFVWQGIYHRNRHSLPPRIW